LVVGGKVEERFQVARHCYSSCDGANDRGKRIYAAQALLHVFHLVAHRFYVDEHDTRHEACSALSSDVGLVR